MYIQRQCKVILIHKKTVFLTDSDDNILITAVLNFTVTFVSICQQCNTIKSDVCCRVPMASRSIWID